MVMINNDHFMFPILLKLTLFPWLQIMVLHVQ